MEATWLKSFLKGGKLLVPHRNVPAARKGHAKMMFMFKWQSPLAAILIMTLVCQEQRREYSAEGGGQDGWTRQTVVCFPFPTNAGLTIMAVVL